MEAQLIKVFFCLSSYDFLFGIAIDRSFWSVAAEKLKRKREVYGGVLTTERI